MDSAIGAIFDMDGVLVDSAAAHFQSWQRLAQECGGKVTEEEFNRTFGQQNRDIIPMLFGQVSDARLNQLADRKEQIYRDLVRGEPPIVPGAVELVRDLHDAGVRLAVGSSGPRENIELILDAMGVRGRIHVVVSGDDVTRGKPDPQVFTMAADRLNVPASRCVVIEDAPAGVEAARAAGALAVAVLIYHPASAFGSANCLVPCLADLSASQILSLAEWKHGRHQTEDNT
jgi:beta-phosphoglucomutase